MMNMTQEIQRKLAHLNRLAKRQYQGENDATKDLIQKRIDEHLEWFQENDISTVNNAGTFELISEEE